MFFLEPTCGLSEVGNADDDVVQDEGHVWMMPGMVLDSSLVKRFSPLVLIALAAAAALALIRSSDDPEPSEDWKPVQPS